MAESCRLGNQNKEVKTTNTQDEKFCIFNVLCVFISLISILADLTTDLIVFAEYCKDGYFYWALGTMVFILTPNILINIFSFRWYITDQKVKPRQWITHGCLVGPLERYIIFLRKVFVCKTLETIKTHKLLAQRNDLSLLHFLYIFTGTVPQIILQMYAIIVLDDNYQTKVFALSASIASLVWGCATYIYSITVFSNNNFKWNSLMLQLLWNFAILIGRIPGILLFTITFGIWILLPMGLHWSAMTFWILTQNTTFCPNKLEETFYNVVMGFIYCFSYINLREGQTRYRLLLFYTLILTQNFGSLFVYVLVSDTELQKRTWSLAATICIIVGTITGMCAMIMYYRYFHSAGPIMWKNSNDIELNNKVVNENAHNNEKGLKHVRSFKSSQKPQSSVEKINSMNTTKDQTSKQESENTDKKNLLDHWIARSGTPTFTSAPVGNTMGDSSIELYTVENTPQVGNLQELNYKNNSTLKKPSKKKFCSPTELTLKLSSIENVESSIDEITTSNLNLHKRRGICSSDELRDNLTNLNLAMTNLVNADLMKIMKIDHSSQMSHDTDGSNKKTSSDSIDMDLDLSFSDINSSDINTFNENIVQKLCLSALKNIKVGNQDADIENIQRIALDILKEMYAKKDKTQNNPFFSKSRDLDTPTEMLSVHDYENICAVNIAREAWGLRSWNGYSDIENWLHDGSVVRDRRRDTLTSASSEISSCISQDLKNAILSAPAFQKKAHTYSNVFVKFDRTNQDDYASTMVCTDDTFLAKPCLTDISKDPIHLEPILEELDDLGDVDPASKKRLNSESSLVATIDEIRKSTVSNSPRNLYHRRDHTWDSPQFPGSAKIDPNLKKALWKEPSKFDSSNIMNSLPEKENIMNISHQSKQDCVKETKTVYMPCSSETIHTMHTLPLSKHIRRKQKINSNHIQLDGKQNINKSHEEFQDISNKNIDFLWQLVSSDNPLIYHSSTEDCTSNRMSTSLQSLIHNDGSNGNLSVPTSKNTNIKKVSRSKPRRKFSILREKFEPRSNFSSDEEMLYHSAVESAINPLENNILNMKNSLILRKMPGVEIETHTAVFENTITSSATDSVIKDKRSLFTKQVLSPPKFNTKLKYKL